MIKGLCKRKPRLASSNKTKVARMLKERLSAANKDVLVSMVKMVQQRRMRGSEGVWEDFLNLHDPKFGASLSDPKRRSVDVLISFLQTFTGEADVKFLEKALQYHLNCEATMLEVKKHSTADMESLELVRLTSEHPEYASSFFFSSYEDDWVVTSMGNMSNANKMLAVDCEMVECEDGTEPAVKVCVVDENLDVKLDKYLNPNKPVMDYRTEITGITSKDLEGVCSLADVQKLMEKLLSDGTILIGHSLHLDMKALKLDHARVIDTSLIFKTKDGKRPSLNNVCKAVLKHGVREEGAQHNCLDDARAAMKLVQAKLAGVDEVIEGNDLSKQLFLHKIPGYVSKEELRSIFLEESAVVIKSRYKEKGKPYSAIAIFKDQHEARDTFQNIQGQEGEDRNGFPQKHISLKLKNGTCARVYIRKSVRDKEGNFIQSGSNEVEDQFAPSKNRRVCTSFVWVRFPGLYLEFWTEKILFAIGKCIGRPIRVDDATLKRTYGYYANVLIEVDFAKPVPEKIVIKGKFGEFYQEIEIPKVPKFCCYCKTVGHLDSECRAIRAVSEKQVVQEDTGVGRNQKKNRNTNKEVPSFDMLQAIDVPTQNAVADISWCGVHKIAGEMSSKSFVTIPPKLITGLIKDMAAHGCEEGEVYTDSSSEGEDWVVVGTLDT